MFLTTRRTLVTGESSDPLSSVVNSFPSIAGAPLASRPAAASVKATRCSAAGCAATVMAPQATSVNRNKNRVTIASPLDDHSDGSCVAASDSGDDLLCQSFRLFQLGFLVTGPAAANAEKLILLQ